MKIRTYHVILAIAAFFAFGVVVGHNTNIYAGRYNGGITVGSVGFELYGAPGFFRTEGK